MELFIDIAELAGGIILIFGLGYLIGRFLKLDKFIKSSLNENNKVNQKDKN